MAGRLDGPATQSEPAPKEQKDALYQQPALVISIARVGRHEMTPLTPIPRDQLALMQEASDALFGAKHRLPMAVLIAGAAVDEIYASVLAGPAGTTDVQAGAELRHFEQAGVLELLPSTPRQPGHRGRPPKRYARRRSVFWELARRFAEERVAGSPPP